MQEQNDIFINTQLSQLTYLPKYSEYLKKPQYRFSLSKEKFDLYCFFLSIFYLVYHKMWYAIITLAFLFVSSIVLLGTVLPAIIPGIDYQITGLLAFLLTQTIMSFWFIDFYHMKAQNKWYAYQDMDYVHKEMAPLTIYWYFPVLIASLISFAIILNMLYVIAFSLGTYLNAKVSSPPVQKETTLQEKIAPHLNSASSPIDLNRLKENQ